MKNPEDSVVAELAPLARLALAYAPRAVRPATAALLALDGRLAGIVRRSSEPILAQLRLAWWREQLAADSAAWPAGEPVLAGLASWCGRHGGLAALVDGWEALTGEAPLPDDRLLAFAQGRAAAFAALAGVNGVPDHAGEASCLARSWALRDLARHVTHASERAAAVRIAGGIDLPSTRLPRELRPLAVLHALAIRDPDRSGAGAMATALRVGLLGR